MDVVQQLRAIGDQLDRQVYPRVWGGGIVRPSVSVSSSVIMGRGNRNGRQKPRRSATAARQGTTGGEGTPGGSWSSRSTAPVLVGSPQEVYARHLTALWDAYPSSQIWKRDEGIWLLVPSTVLEGLDRNALFLVVVPYDFRYFVQAWGFWIHAGSSDPIWIGPRHTNYPDGSICAFHVLDGTWQNGEPLTSLFDLYSLWAARHLHLELFGRWPGSQHVIWPHERMIETQPGELCACGSRDKLYSDCCEPGDARRNRVAEAMRYSAATNGGRRSVPPRILNFIRERGEPPPVWGYAARLALV